MDTLKILFFFICLAAYLTFTMLFLANRIIEVFNDEFENINKGGKNGKRKKNR